MFIFNEIQFMTCCLKLYICDFKYMFFSSKIECQVAIPEAVFNWMKIHLLFDIYFEIVQNMNYDCVSNQHNEHYSDLNDIQWHIQHNRNIYYWFGIQNKHRPRPAKTRQRDRKSQKKIGDILRQNSWWIRVNVQFRLRVEFWSEVENIWWCWMKWWSEWHRKRLEIF